MKFMCKVFILFFHFVFIHTGIMATNTPLELKVISWGLLKEWGITDGFEQYAQKRGMNIKLSYVEPFLVTIPDCFYLLRSKKFGDKPYFKESFYKKAFLMQPMGSHSFNLYNREWFNAVRLPAGKTNPTLKNENRGLNHYPNQCVKE